MRRVRIFVSSPSDVDFERQRVDRVAERLNGAFAEIVRFDPTRWENKFYSADRTFQHQIPEAAECDLVIAIFWSRMGSPLPHHFGPMPNGEHYPSGSAYEVLTAIEARRSGEKPDVYVFRKAAPPLHRIDQDEALDDAKAQWKALNEFFARWFHTPDGEFLAAFHQFHTTDEFEEQIERLLRQWVDDHIPHSRSVSWPIEMGSPFRALLPFDAKHAPVYFGCDRKVTRAIEQLKNVAQGLRDLPSGPRRIPFLLIVGESGAGKSSLMRAGVAPRLTAPGAVPSVDLWRTAIMRVGDDANPFLTLAAALLVRGKGDDEGGFGAALPELRHGGEATPGCSPTCSRTEPGRPAKGSERQDARSSWRWRGLRPRRESAVVFSAGCAPICSSSSISSKTFLPPTSPTRSGWCSRGFSSRSPPRAASGSWRRCVPTSTRA
jgi:hypothetical protein